MGLKVVSKIFLIRQPKPLPTFEAIPSLEPHSLILHLSAASKQSIKSHVKTRSKVRATRHHRVVWNSLQAQILR